MGTRILIADDDPIHRRNIEAMVLRMGYRTVLADSGAGALNFATQRKDIALMLLDMSLTDMDGFTVLARLREARVSVPVIVMVQDAELAKVVQAIKLGAVDFITKPAMFERVQLAVPNALKIDALTHEIRRNRSFKTHFALSDITAASPEMERVVTAARRAAALDAPLLIEGEAGTGKETLARAICAGGARWRGAFIDVDCRLLTRENADHILFADPLADPHGNVGKLAAAEGGTLFLDEVGALPRHAQLKLFAAMQSGEFETGGVRLRSNARIIASTTQPLGDLVAMGRFHAGLARLLGSFSLAVPPLRDRPEDIPVLLRHFTLRYASEERRSHIGGIAPQAMEKLKAYQWPGNIRQLKNEVFRAVLICETSELTLADFAGLDREIAQEAAPQGAGAGLISGVNADGEVRTLASAEADMIRFAIAHYDGQISEVARRLGIGRTTLYRKLKEYDIDVASLSGKGGEDAEDDENGSFTSRAG